MFWADENKEKQVWFYVRVGDCRYHALLENEISLRALFERSEDGWLYVVVITKDNHYEIDRLSSYEISSKLLPRQGVYLLPPKPRMSF